MTQRWDAAREASKRSLPRPRVDNGLVTTLHHIPAEQVQAVFRTGDDRACPACGYITCDPASHTLPPEWVPGLRPPGAGRAFAGLAVHPRTSAAVWCIARDRWAYQHRWDPCRPVDGDYMPGRVEAMVLALLPLIRLERGQPGLWQLLTGELTGEVIAPISEAAKPRGAH